MAIGWQRGMETGAPLLDARHRALVERADALVATLESGGDRTSVEKALRSFGDSAVRHFSQEEDCTLRDRCPALQWSGAARADLLAIISGFRLSFERNGPTPSVAAQLSDSLSEWVGRYIPGPGAGSLPCLAAPR